MFTSSAPSQAGAGKDQAAAPAEEFFPDDPTLSACCLRDMEDRKQAAKWKAELKRNDPVERSEIRARQGAGIASLFTNDCDGHHSHVNRQLRLPKGTFVEISECDITSAIANGDFVVCLALAESPSQLELSIKEWLDGMDCALVSHRFRPSTCRSCFLNENIRLPALILWNKGERLLALERNRLEAETEGSLLSRLTLMRRQASDGDKSDNSEDEDERKTGRSSYFKCGKAGCSRTFHHVHVQNKWKNSEFDKDEDVDMDDAESDDDDR